MIAILRPTCSNFNSGLLPACTVLGSEYVQKFLDGQTKVTHLHESDFYSTFCTSFLLARNIVDFLTSFRYHFSGYLFFKPVCYLNDNASLGMLQIVFSCYQTLGGV